MLTWLIREKELKREVEKEKECERPKQKQRKQQQSDSIILIMRTIALTKNIVPPHSSNQTISDT